MHTSSHARWYCSATGPSFVVNDAVTTKNSAFVFAGAESDEIGERAASLVSVAKLTGFR